MSIITATEQQEQHENEGKKVTTEEYEARLEAAKPFLEAVKKPYLDLTHVETVEPEQQRLLADGVNAKVATRLSDRNWIKLVVADAPVYEYNVEDFKGGVVKVDDFLSDVVSRDTRHTAAIHTRKKMAVDCKMLGGRRAELTSYYYKMKHNLKGLSLEPYTLHGNRGVKSTDMLVDNPLTATGYEDTPGWYLTPNYLSIDVKVVGVNEEKVPLTKWKAPVVVDDVDDFHYEYLKSIALGHPMIAVEKWSAKTDDVVVMPVSSFDNWVEDTVKGKLVYKAPKENHITHDNLVDLLKDEGEQQSFNARKFIKVLATALDEERYGDAFTILTRKPAFMSASVVAEAVSLVSHDKRLAFLKSLENEHTGADERVSEDVGVLKMFGLLPAKPVVHNPDDDSF